MSAVIDLPPTSLIELTKQQNRREPWYLDLVLPEIGGGRLTSADLNRIDEAPKARALRVSGLDQPVFEALVTRYGTRFSGIHFWKCPRITDLSPLEDLPALTHVAFFWNQRATRLWDFSKTPILKGLQFEGFTRLRTWDDLARATSLLELVCGDGVWVKSTIPSLAPLADLKHLRRLAVRLRKVEDNRVQPLAQLRRLELLECPSNLFTTEQLAWLRAHLPPSALGRVLAPIMKLDKPLPSPDRSAPRDVLVMGKRKPWLNAAVDAERIRRYEDAFERLVERFRADPLLEP